MVARSSQLSALLTLIALGIAVLPTDLGGVLSLTVAGIGQTNDDLPLVAGATFDLLSDLGMNFNNQEWQIIYAIFTVAMLIVIVSYWLSLRADDKMKPAASEKIAELRTSTAILPVFARTELSVLVAESEAMFAKKNYTRALRRAEAAMVEVSKVREVIEQTRVSVAASQDKLDKARAKGLAISDEAVGLAALRRELGVER